MQSNLFKFMRHMEEKELKRKRSRSETESVDLLSEDKQTDGKKLRTDAGETPKGSKLQSFAHTKKTPTVSSLDRRNPCDDKPINTQKNDSEVVPQVTGKPLPTSLPTCKSKGKTKLHYTPLEQQYLAIKAAYPDALLFIECGYKYRFFGEDAEIASRVLKIGCFYDHNFFTGSIPVHRLNVHLRRLVAAGYKVGVVKQMETAALKAASDNKSGPFTRELTELYTRSTLIGPDVEEQNNASDEGGTFLMCVREVVSIKSVNKKEVTVGFMAVQPSAGNILYDDFRDNIDSFSELETRLSHIQPVEIIFPQGTSKRLEQMLMDWKKYAGSDLNVLRVEAVPPGWFEYNRAFSVVTEFYGNLENTSIDSSKRAEALQVAINLPSLSLSCLSGLIHYLKPFNLQRVLSLTKSMKPFNTGIHCMRLNSRTLESLEIFRNQSDRTEKGSLFWVLNHTQTPFGRRLLSNWISFPLKNISKIKLRQEAVSELSDNEKPSLSLLISTLHSLPDLEKKLCNSYHKKSSPADFYYLVKTLSQVSQQLDSFSEMALCNIKSELLLKIIKEVPELLRGIDYILDNLSEKAAKVVDYENLFVKLELFPNVLKEKEAITDVKQKLLDHRKLFRKTLSNNSLDYVTVSGDQYLVEVKNRDVHIVPADWHRVSSTKQVTRYRPPYVTESLNQLAQHHEQLLVHAKEAWDSVLNDFSAYYQSYKRAVDLLATADCLVSLSEVARIPGYVCPDVVEEQVIEISEGRHPVIDLLLEGGQFVANSTKLDRSGLQSMIITGPNMGGKSSYIKQVALICILSQIGSFVPAEAARLGILDGVYTRMGAYDNILSGKSTFMMELTEAAEIMKLSTERSLVIMDELGRGTSTHDGTAIAYATLTYFIEKVRCLTLFVTHYPVIVELEEKYPLSVGNFHMAYVEVEDAEEEFDRVVFLYHLDKGQAGASYGLNVASLAGLPSTLLKIAHHKSKLLEEGGLFSTEEEESESKSSDYITKLRSVLTLTKPQNSISQALKKYFL